MKVLVLGGTGAMGEHLVGKLADNAIETVVTSRNARESQGCVSYIKGNARDIDFLQGLLQTQWDAIIDFMVYTTVEFENRCQLLLGSTTQYVFLSSARVYADSDLITEESPRLLDVSQDEEYLATDEYALAKARQENILTQSGKTNWTIIRPYITYSNNRLQLGVLEKEEWLYRALQGRTVVFSADIAKNHSTMTYGGDVANGIMSTLGNADALGQVFQVTTAQSIAWHDVLKIYLDVLEEHLGQRPNVLFLDLADLMTLKPAQYQIMYDRLFDRAFDNTKISRQIDTKQFTDVCKGLKCCLEQFLTKPEFSNINWKSEAIKDRQTRELASWREIPGLRNKAVYLKNRFL